ncbi:MAG TPA: hypothetical protein PLP61_16790, partial [Nocardioides sp.]
MTHVQTRSAQGPTLDDLDEQARYAAYDALQRRMPEVWGAMRRDAEGESVVVVPSVSLERSTARTGTAMQALEERALFLLLLLRQPRLRMVFVTSMPVADQIVEYYLGLLPGVIPSQARSRLSLVSVGDATPRALSAKLLERPRLLGEIRALIPNATHSHLVPYTVTALERDLALTLGIPVYGSDPRLAVLGTKSGCRRIFEELGVDCPLGAQDLHTVDDLVTAVCAMRSRRPAMTQAIVKLDDGVAGAGNALLDLAGMPTSGQPDEADRVRDRVLAMSP